MAYDRINEKRCGLPADKVYLSLLHLAFQEGETAVDRALERLLEARGDITEETLREELIRGAGTPSQRDVAVAPVDLSLYDALLEDAQVAA